MTSFFDRLSVKLDAESAAATAVPQSVPARAVPSGPRTSAPQGKAPVDNAPEAGSDELGGEDVSALGVDLFQSETRIVVFFQMSGVAIDGFDITVDEDANTLLVQASQKRPDMPSLKGAKENEGAEKGRFVKQEIKWGNLYRKVYLPAPVEAGEAEALFKEGVLIVVLPTKKTGEGRKLKVKEIINPEPPK